MKNPKILIALFVAVIILLIGGGVAYFVIAGGNASDSEDEGVIEQNFIELTSDDIGLTFDVASSNQEIVMRATKLEGVESLEYEASYEREFEEDGETGIRPDGVLGSPIEVSGETEIEREIYLGTCSATCTPHNVVSDVKFVIKVNYENGEIGVIEETVELNQE